ncbi:MAG TPA: APC family permease [Candidatus Limnocylindrales bacterium]|jgi:amino acid transporter
MVANESAGLPASEAGPFHTDLEEDAIGLLGATMQAITHIAPAIAGFFFTAFIVSLAGITAPLAYFIGFLVVLMLGSTLAQLSKHMPSAGGYYTYVSRALHPRLGFLTSWMYILYSPVTGGPVAGMFGFIVQGELLSNWNIDVPWLWWVTILVFTPLTAALQWRGIKLSARFMLITGGLEMIIVMALAITGFIDPPTGTGITLNVFNPSFIPAGEGFALAVVFTVQGLTGWEASAPLAEETKDPRRNVPLSVYLSIILIGSFLVIVFWGVVTGFGNDASAITGSTELPALVLAHRVWGAGWIIILIAFLNSALAVQIACANVGTRMWYGMARSGSFPRQLAKVDPVHKTPTNAILLEMVVNAVVALYVGFVFGPDTGFFLMTGLILVLAVSFAYIFANVAVFRLYWTEYRSEFNVILHVIFPVVSTLVLLYAIYKSFPLASPFDLAPPVDGLWFLLGILILVVLRARGHEDWLAKAGESIAEA